ncbi:MAG: SH3 domain-containing protein, partial [Planctomycetes bacterium]|nr:SH3 domain-containing protein [Planctomycetota bacterium]
MRSACRSILVLGLGLAALSLALPAVAQTASPVFPYKAYISANGVYVRSGPGRNYYPTEKMKEGQEIEVYRHDPGGWYAIKPPEGSFTWVAARYLKPESENLASVIGDRVAARVGSRFSNIRDVIQLRLDREETVELLGAEPQGVGAQAEIWCRISPPAGEFRWVHGKYVDANFPHSGIRKTGPRHTPAGTSDHEGQAVAHSEPPTDRSSITPAAVVRAFEEDAPADQTRQPSPQPVSRAESRWNDDLQEEIEDIDLELSVMLAEEASVWEFSELAARARTVIDRAETALQRGRARVLINKIARSDDIRRRYQQVHAMREV